MTAPTMRRVTPAAYQVLKADASRELWLAERRNGVGSSDIAKIAGVADRQQAVHVYQDKLGILDDDAGEAALWGTLLEDTVAQEWCRRNRSVITRVGLVANVDEPWMMTTLDRLVRACPLDRNSKARCALEVKTRSAFKADRWHKATPDDVHAQTLWQRRVTGLNHIHVAVLIGGNDYRQTVVREDEELETWLAGQGANFWFNHVQAQVEPPWDYENHPEDLIALDKRLHPDKVGELTVEGIGEVFEYAEASAVAGAAKKARDASAARLLHLAGGHQFVKFADQLAYSYGERSKSNCDLALLAERHPDAYAECVTETKFYAIQIAKAYRKGKA